MDISELVRKCYEMNIALKKEDLVVLNFGNASVCDRTTGLFAIKPSGFGYGGEELKPEDIVVLNLAGEKVHGNLKPSSDTPTHLFLYQQFPTITSVVHTHSTYATAWAQSGRDIPVYGTTHADFTMAPIPCTEPLSESQLRGEYERETGVAIKEILEKRHLTYQETSMCIVFGHGAFTWSSESNTALVNAIALETIAKMAAWTEKLNPDVQVLPKNMAEKHFNRKHGKSAYYGQA